MIQISKTQAYTVRPKSLLSGAFDVSYGRFADTQTAVPPDTATMVCSNISMLLIILMLLLTASRYPSERVLWYALSAGVVVIIGIIVRRYLRTRKEYLQAAGKPSTIQNKRNEFFALFETDGPLPDEMPSAGLLDKIRPLLGRQNDPIVNTALRSINDDLNAKNNPVLPRGRLLTPLADTFTQPRRRFYFTEENGKLLFIDDEWMQPLGQIECTPADVVSFGRYAQYPPQSINSADGGKIRPDAVIIELQDESQHLYFEFRQSEYEAIRKILPGKKERK